MTSKADLARPGEDTAPRPLWAVLARYPDIRVAFGESGIGWIPYTLDRMDFE